MELQTFSAQATEELRCYLEAVTAMLPLRPLHSRFQYRCVEEFVLRHGQAFTTRVCRPSGMWPGVPRCCFQNAAMLATTAPERYTYVEGYAVGVIPVLHAWVRDTSGAVLDITWPEEQMEGAAYWGVAVKTAYVRRTVMAGKGPALDNAADRFPLLTGAHRLHDALVRVGIDAESEGLR